MSPKEMAEKCVEVINAGASHVTFIKASKMPPGFPRGEFLSDAGRGKIYSYDAVRVLQWMLKSGLAKAEITPYPAPTPPLIAQAAPQTPACQTAVRQSGS